MHGETKIKSPGLLREIDLIRVKGKHQPVAVFESLEYREDEADGALGEMLAFYDRGLDAYRARDWRGAEAIFAPALEIMSADGPSSLSLQRCNAYAAAPPAHDWDGVWTIKDK